MVGAYLYRRGDGCETKNLNELLDSPFNHKSVLNLSVCQSALYYGRYLMTSAHINQSLPVHSLSTLSHWHCMGCQSGITPCWMLFGMAIKEFKELGDVMQGVVRTGNRGKCLKYKGYKLHCEMGWVIFTHFARSFCIYVPTKEMFLNSGRCI